MRVVASGVVGFDLSQFLLGFAKALIILQIQHDPSALAFGIGEKLLFFESRCFHGEELARFQILRNAFLKDQLHFPFAAKCVRAISFSPLRAGERVEVTEMADPEACAREMFVTIQFAERSIAVPLSQLHPMAASADNAS